MPTSKKISYVTAREQEGISRAVLSWLKKHNPDIEFEYLPPERSGMSLTTIQGAYKTAQYIDGSYEAQYQFGILYRSLPTDSEERLDAESELNKLGEWAEENWPDLGDEKNVTTVQRTSSASLLARYDDNVEDYQILMTMEYEVGG
ncbi:hypothetical protein RX717_12725 [Intestinibacillus sp. NTUH-41-i26]|uniref:hypothetical protein n=1 Tax=Intestinibacillus sp. NTUH-41-i26 TaxID=3079303 RepID=UPI0029341011|nr:hypothetical protein [Intestinibacillus sp. NTUH-41-i26]WOC74833.1 hypothetical protein RX717_12725 [Intestinibacillus sp. NTUH-41-i26]